MNFSKSFYLSFILLLVFSTLLAAAGIRGFLRLAPSIEQINKHNTQSLYIAESMMSDFVVLGQNPFEVDESTIKDIPVCRTYLAGELVYEA